MADKSKVFNIALPAELVKKVDEVAKKEYKNRSELIREALRLYLNESSEGRQIHGKAEESRLSGNLARALELIDQALINYQREKDVLGFAEGLSSKVLTLRQLYEQTNDRNYLILAKHTGESSVEIARESGNKEALALPLETLANLYVEMGNIKGAIPLYKEAVENMEKNPYKIHDRPALVAKMKATLHLCEYLEGEKAALGKAEAEAEKILKVEDPSERDQHAWYALAELKIAQALKKGTPQQAKAHLDKALKMIASDPKLDFLKEKGEKVAGEF